tara:strand:- start:1376 stop:1651 length:276 start_codon:yes stop_codon:yes gene_type:complete
VPGKADFPVRSLTRIACAKEKLSFVRIAANGSFESMLQDFCFAANVGCQETAQNLQQGLVFGKGFSAASKEEVCAGSKNEGFGRDFEDRQL